MPRKSKRNDSDEIPNLRERCLDIALEFLGQHGVAGLSLREVARVAEVSSAAPYRHFADKPALLVALAIRGYLLFADQLRSSAINGTENIDQDQFFEMARNYVRFAKSQPQYYHLMFDDVIRDQRSHPDLWKVAQSGFQVLVQSIETLQAKGLIRKEKPIVLASFVWSQLHGFCVLHRNGILARADIAIDVLLDRLEPHLQLTMSGILIPSASASTAAE